MKKVNLYGLINSLVIISSISGVSLYSVNSIKNSVKELKQSSLILKKSESLLLDIKRSESSSLYYNIGKDSTVLQDFNSQKLKSVEGVNELIVLSKSDPSNQIRLISIKSLVENNNFELTKLLNLKNNTERSAILRTVSIFSRQISLLCLQIETEEEERLEKISSQTGTEAITNIVIIGVMLSLLSILQFVFRGVNS